MTTPHDPDTQAVIETLLREHGLAGETRLFREMMRDSLQSAPTPGIYRKVEVEVVLGEILRQGGRIYPVESVTVERAWYCTLPEGFVDVRPLG